MIDPDTGEALPYGCIDFPDGWHDSDGGMFHCEWYSDVSSDVT